MQYPLGKNLINARIPSLDGIRAGSIALVILSHFGKDIGWGDPLDLGSLGVRVFFVISGYLITSLLLKELEQEGRIRLLRFYFRRTLRIFPAFYFYLSIMLALAALGWIVLPWQDALPAITYTSNYFVPMLKPVIKHTWSLSTEEQFYLLWPAVLMLTGRRAGVLALLVLLTAAPVLAYFFTLNIGYNVPTFFNGPIGIGSLFALIQGNLRKSIYYKRWIASSFGFHLPLLIFSCNYTALHVRGAIDQILYLVLNFLIAFALDWAIVNRDYLVCRWLNSRPMVYAGTLSYSLYLWQQPFLGINGDPYLTLPGTWTGLRNPLIQFSAIAACTLISYYGIERPFLRWRARFEPQVFPPKASQNIETVPVLADAIFGANDKAR
jgi:peptidoglycan/LPS O-acetylase OafA/YrhL